MSVYAYTALGKDGRKTSGTLTCDNRSAAIAQMSRQGLHPVTIEEARDAAAATKKVQAASAATTVNSKVPAGVVEAFTRELANLLAGGVPLARALALLRREAPKPAGREIWRNVHDDVAGGSTVADALAKWPRILQNVYIAMVRAGETGGFLDVVL